MSDGWNESAQAWIAGLENSDDFARPYVLDRPMLDRVRLGRYQRALDVGCGEGRFCRMMQKLGLKTVGVDPTEALLNQARKLDPQGDYILAKAEEMDVPEAGFDLVVSYLSLIDIAGLEAAVACMVNALCANGRLLIANLNPFNTAGFPSGGWREDGYLLDDYLQERTEWLEWRGIRIQNHHRPMVTYMQAFLQSGLVLSHFDEPSPYGGPSQKARKYTRVPYFHIMEWRKP